MLHQLRWQHYRCGRGTQVPRYPVKALLGLFRITLCLNQPIEDRFCYGFRLGMDLEFLVNAAQVE